jgi:phage gp36-like protein
MAYTTREKIQRLMGEDYERLVLQSLTELGQDETFVDEIIAEVDGTINMYAGNVYAAADLLTSPWVQRKATWMACHLLSRSKGNPGNFLDEYDEAMEQLERILAGNLQIPGIARLEGAPATMQTPMVDNRFRGYRDRIDTEHSTQSTPGQRDAVPISLYDWLW